MASGQMASRSGSRRNIGDNIRLGLVGLGLLLLVAFFAVNFEQVEVGLLIFSPEMPLAFALVLAAAIGLLVGLLLGSRSASRNGSRSPPGPR